MNKPFDVGNASSIERASQGFKKSTVKVIRIVLTAHTLTNYFSRLRNIIVRYGNILTTVCINHDAMGEG